MAVFDISDSQACKPSHPRRPSGAPDPPAWTLRVRGLQQAVLVPLPWPFPFPFPASTLPGTRTSGMAPEDAVQCTRTQDPGIGVRYIRHHPRCSWSGWFLAASSRAREHSSLQILTVTTALTLAPTLATVCATRSMFVIAGF